MFHVTYSVVYTIVDKQLGWLLTRYILAGSSDRKLLCVVVRRLLACLLIYVFLVFVYPSNICVKFVMLVKAQIGLVSNMIVNEYFHSGCYRNLYIYIVKLMSYTSWHNETPKKTQLPQLSLQYLPNSA